MGRKPEVRLMQERRENHNKMSDECGSAVRSHNRPCVPCIFAPWSEMHFEDSELWTIFSITELWITEDPFLHDSPAETVSF